MAKDNTVIGSLAVLVVGIVLSNTGIIHTSENGQPWWFVIVVWIAAFRIVMILPIQTLVHSVKHDPEAKRVKWVLAHVFLWPIAGLGYYFTTKKY